MAARKIEQKGWIVDFRFTHASGETERVRKRSPVQTKRGAEDYERQLRQEMLNPNRVERKQVPTLQDFGREFIDTYAKANNKRSEVVAKESIFRVRLVPALGAKRLDQITPRDIERWKARWLAVDKLSRKRVNNILTVLGRALRYAHEDLRLIEAIPKIRFLKVALPDFDFLTFEELAQLRDGANDEPEVLAAVLVAAHAGLRAGEIRALKRDDIDFANGWLTVQRSVYQGYEDSPKGGRLRRVEMTRQLAAALKAARHLRGQYVFCGADGKPWSRGELDARLWRACRRAKLRKIGWHKLRHTFCSHLAMRAVPAKTIQELAGHASLSTTLRYMHLSPNEKRKAIALLEDSDGHHLGTKPNCKKEASGN